MTWLHVTAGPPPAEEPHTALQSPRIEQEERSCGRAPSYRGIDNFVIIIYGFGQYIIKPTNYIYR
jgi:hypothetical protein